MMTKEEKLKLFDLQLSIEDIMERIKKDLILGSEREIKDILHSRGLGLKGE